MNLQRQLLVSIAFCLAIGANAQEQTQGLKLPRLTTAERTTISDSGSPYAKGQTIYNTDTNCLEYWNGDDWVSFCAEPITPDPPLPPKDETGQYRLSGKTCYDVAVTDYPAGNICLPLDFRVNDFESEFSFNYTFSGSADYDITDYYAVGDGKNLLNLSRAGDIITATFVGNVRDLATNTTKTFTLIVTFDDVNNDPKYVSIDVSVQDCVCGCPVKTVDGGWLTFLCYNLGADKTMTIDQQMAYPSPVCHPCSSGQGVDATVYGDLYQWGRNTDGHEKRTSANTAPNATVTTDTPGHGDFIRTSLTPWDWRKPQNGNLWQPSTKTNNPCPAGYRVPTQEEWSSIVSGGTTMLTMSGGTATGTSGNKWTWNSSGTAGYKISPDNGTTTTLFLPAAGFRHTDGSLNFVGSRGYCWSSTVTSINAYFLFFANNSVSTGTNEHHGYGKSVRCVAE